MRSAIPADSNRTAPYFSLRGLFIAQFCGAFNDNAWKLMVALLGIRSLAALSGPSANLESASQAETAKAFIVFTLPLMLVSLVAGVLVDRISKRTILVTMKAIEVGLMSAGTLALVMDPAGGWLPLLVLGCMGIHSAIFSPAKYGILPELVSHEHLTEANGWLEMVTFLAILLGTAGGGLLLDLSGTATWCAGTALTLMALVGFGASWSIPPVLPARTAGGLGWTLGAAWTTIQSDRVLRLAVIGTIYFWTIASLFGQDILVYAKALLHLSDSLSGLPLTTLAIGIGAGAMLAGRISGPRIEYGLIPLGSFGVAALLLLMGALAPALSGTLILMALLGVAGGFLLVPLDALIQWRAPDDRRGAVLALWNTGVFGGVLLGSLAGDGLAAAGLSTKQILLVAGGLTILGTLWALWLVPDALIRLIIVLFTKTIYRLRIVGVSHVPADGGVLLVPNHISFVDGFLLMASLDRPVRFVVDAQYAEHPLLKPLARTMSVIPIASHGGPRVILRALRDAGQALDAGEVVCIFPEGQITRTGTLLPFRRGFERIVKGRAVPIVPVHLDRVWGSIFSFVGGRFLFKWPERIPYPVTVSFGQALPSDTPSYELRRAVQELGEAAWRLRKPDRRPLHVSFIKRMRRHPFRFAMADVTRPHVSSLQALTGSIVLARLLRAHWQGQSCVGLLLPPTVAGALVNVATILCGKTSVNLNYTVGRAGLESACRQAQLRTILTSRKFIEKAKLELPDGPRILWLEDLAATIGPCQKLMGLLLAGFAPIRLIERACGQQRRTTIDELATIIFSSGSTGEPKGVMLSYFSVDSNIEGVSQVFHVGAQDRALGILPFFHSFGYLIFWFATHAGVGIIFHPSPLDAGAIGELMGRYRITLLVTTPTFLQLYLRRCTPDQFSSLRVVLTGAEKLQARLSQAFEDRFGIRPVEGYGVTECAPVICVNCPDFRAAGFFQSASRRGTVGQPLPGVCVRIVDPDTFAPLPPNQPGMLLVRGSNVMDGYLGRQDLTEKAMRDGWYITGDIAILDDDGFVTITDRLSRFSKIGGEMVPHGRVEEALHQAAGFETQVFAVTGIPDERKGEALAVVHTYDETKIPDLLEKVGAIGLSNLFIPSKSNFIKVDALPVLGTGKLDLRALKLIAMDRLLARDT